MTNYKFSLNPSENQSVLIFGADGKITFKGEADEMAKKLFEMFQAKIDDYVNGKIAEARREERARCAKMLMDYERQCSESAEKLSEDTSETGQLMYWRADGACDALELIAQKIREMED